MYIKKHFITLILLLFGVGIAHSQEQRTEICINFRANSAVIESDYMDNAARIQEMKNLLQTVNQDGSMSIVEVTLCGASSPEGSHQLNKRLAQERLAALEKYLREDAEVPANLIVCDNDSNIFWSYLKEQVAASDLPYKDEVVTILNQDEKLVDYNPQTRTHIDSRVWKLKRVAGGKAWAQMKKLYFNQMRMASAVFVTNKKEVAPVEEPVVVAEVEKAEPQLAVEVKEEVVPVEPVVEDWSRKLHVKTNLLGWGMAVANVAAEVDLAKHLSFALPVYYSGWNYFKSSIKFRTLAIQPELRYWVSENNNGFFAGAHFGLAQYNVAVDGVKRYQDCDGKSPALGGGLSIGYRMPISKNEKWNLEFTLGAGAYDLKYDTFYNVENGKKIDTHRKTYWGIDNAAINLTYCFDLKKRK